MKHKDHNFRWKILPYYYLNYLGPYFSVLKMSFLKNEDLNSSKRNTFILPSMYFGMKKCQCVNKSCNEVTNIRMQLLWGNTYIKENKLCLWWKHWLKSGILFIGDIIDAKGDADVNRAK